MIRHAVSQDAEEIYRIRMAAIRELATGHYSEDQISAWQGNGNPRSYEAPIAEKVLLVEESVAGLCGFAQLDVDACIVERLYVSPLYARRGTGKRLLLELELVAREFGVTMLCVDATLNAVSFYQSAGYLAVEMCEHELQPGIVFPCMAMVKALRE